MSSYKPLADYLSQLKKNRVKLNFSQIERILGRQLPNSAHTHRAWWANSWQPSSHYWSYLWCSAGWYLTECDLSGKTVVFESVDRDEVPVGTLNISPTKMLGEAYEGERREITVLRQVRNRKIVEERRRKDRYTCQACGLSLFHNGKFVLDVHHLHLLSRTEDEITNIADLVSLCPTCHRLAHTAEEPLSVKKLKRVLMQKATVG